MMRGDIQRCTSLSRSDSEGYEDSLQQSKEERMSCWIERLLFPNLPDHYSLAKKLYIVKYNSPAGRWYSILVEAFSVLLCLDFLVQGRTHSYRAVQSLFYLETILVLGIVIDSFVSCFISRLYIRSLNFALDLVTVFPTLFVLFFVIVAGKRLNYFEYEYMSLMKLVRVLRMFRTLSLFKLRFQRILFKLVLTFASLTFIASGFLHLFENVFPQADLECQYINENTNWQPSCSEVAPASYMTYCDCEENKCEYLYDVVDQEGHPTLVRCEPNLSFNSCAYFILITISLVGYGSESTSIYSKGVVVVLIFIALFTLPGQFTDIEHLVNSRSQFNNPYNPVQKGDNHIIVCGHVNNKQKLSAFLREFLHPDRMFSNSVQFHVVVLHPDEPSSEIIDMITSYYFYQKVTYVVGSSLVVNDLKRARADEAFGMFFLCDTEVTSSMAQIEDVSTVTRALSVSNYNPLLSCFAQVLKSGEREILHDSGVELILCLDEFKTSLMAKNVVCPGISTFVENLFHSFGGLSAAQEASLAPWHQEYIHGVHMELYYVLLNPTFLQYLNYDFQAICDLFFVEFETIVVGVATENQSKVTFNPTSKEMYQGHRSWKDYFDTYNVAVVLADSNLQTEKISNDISIPDALEGMLERVVARVSSNCLGRNRSYVTTYKKIRGNDEDGKTKRKTRYMSSRTNLVSKSTRLVRESILFRSKFKKVGIESPVGVNSCKYDNDYKSDEGNDSEVSDFESVDGDEDDYAGFTERVRVERKTQRQLLRSGNSNFRLPTRVYIDTHRSLTPYHPRLISHMKEESKNPLLTLKLGEKITATVAAGQKLQANNSKNDLLAIRASARRKSNAALKAVGGVVKMSRFVSNSISSSEVGISAPKRDPTIAASESQCILVPHAMVKSGDDRSGDELITTDGCKEKYYKKHKNMNNMIHGYNHGYNQTHSKSNRTLSFNSKQVQDDHGVGIEYASDEDMIKEPSLSKENVLEQEQGMLLSKGPLMKNILPTLQNDTTTVVDTIAGSGNVSPADQVQKDSDETCAISAIESSKNSHLKIPGPPLVLIASPSPKKSLAKITCHAPSSRGSSRLNAARNHHSRSLCDDQENANSGDSVCTASNVRLKPQQSSTINFTHHPTTEESDAVEQLIPQIKEKLKFTQYDKPSISLNFASHQDEAEFSSEARFMEINVTKSRPCRHRESTIKPALSRREGNEGDMNNSDVDELECETISDDEDFDEFDDVFDAEALAVVPSTKEVLKNIKPEGIEVKVIPKQNLRMTRIQAIKVVKLGYSDDDSDSSSVFSSEDDDARVFIEGQGNRSRDISDAMHLTGHIIVFGCSPDNLLVFISDLRNPQVKGIFYHPIVIVDSHPPDRWDTIQATYNDVYFLPGDLTRSKIFNRINIDEAYACVLMHNREGLSALEVEENVDSKTIITYLKIEHYVPASVTFSVELVCKENMNVLNSTLMQRAGGTDSRCRSDRRGGGANRRVFNRREFFANQTALFRAYTEQPKEKDEGDDELYETSLYASMLSEYSTVRGPVDDELLYSVPGSSEMKVPMTKVGNALAAQERMESIKGDLDFPKRNVTNIDIGGFISLSYRNSPSKHIVGLQSNENAQPQILPSTISRSSQLWQGAVKATLNRQSFATNHRKVGFKKHESQFPVSEPQQARMKILLKTGRRTVSHQNKLLVISEDGQKKSAYTVSSAFNSLYKDDEGDDKLSSSDIIKNKSADNDYSFVANLKERGWLSMVNEWSACLRKHDKEDENEYIGVRHGWTDWTTWWNCRRCQSVQVAYEIGGRNIATDKQSNNVKVEKISSLQYLQTKSREKLGISDSFWDASESHYILPVFASGRAYVPSTFESLLVQSFFGGLAPMICELFVCGQNSQALLQVDIPLPFIDKTFSDLCLYFLSHRIICLGIYRAPQPRLGSLFPYLYISPPGCAEVYSSDRAFVFGSYSRLHAAMEEANKYDVPSAKQHY